MSGTFPSTPVASQVQVSSVTRGFRTESQSGRRSTRYFGIQKWKLNCTFPGNMSRDQFKPILGFLMAQKGQFDTFTYVPPDMATPRGTGNGTPQVQGGSQTGTSLTTDGWAASETVLKAGDVFKLANHTKVYMITEDITSTAGGVATLVFQPPLLESPLDNSAVTISNVPFTVELESDSLDHNVYGPLLYSFSIGFIEAF